MWFRDEQCLVMAGMQRKASLVACGSRGLYIIHSVPFCLFLFPAGPMRTDFHRHGKKIKLDLINRKGGFCRKQKYQRNGSVKRIARLEARGPSDWLRWFQCFSRVFARSCGQPLVGRSRSKMAPKIPAKRWVAGSLCESSPQEVRRRCRSLAVMVDASIFGAPRSDVSMKRPVPFMLRSVGG